MDKVWSTVAEWWRFACGQLAAIAKLTEDHPGLGAWVSAVLAAAAIIVTVWVSVGDRNRAQKHETEGFNAQIDLFARIASELRPFVQQYVKLSEEKDLSASGYYNTHLNDGVFRRAGDLNGVPVTQWPSVESYNAYKDYFLACIRLLETPKGAVGGTSFDDRKERFVATYDVLQKVLTGARR